MNEEGFQIEVQYQAAIYRTIIPFRYEVELYVDGMETGIRVRVWGFRNADRLAAEMADHGNELLDDFGLASEMAAAIYMKRREAAMSAVKVGDSVKLLVDLGPYKKGRVCKVVSVAEPEEYERGSAAWNAARFPISVVPVRVASDPTDLGPKESIPLAAGEYGPVNEEVGE